MVSTARLRTERPASVNEAAEIVRAAGGRGLTVRARGGGTKLDWGRPGPRPDVELLTAGLGRIVEHNAADLTAVVEAGVPLAVAQRTFAEAGQMLALDPSLGPEDAATVGGVVAVGDSGPLRHRYGALRDLLVGVTAVLADGTVAKAGGKVIKNVAGYDLGKLLCGSFGTLGLVAQVAVRLHPLPAGRATAVGSTTDPHALQRAVGALAAASLELESLDLAWGHGSGRVLARCAGVVPEPRAREAARLMSDAGVEGAVSEDDGDLWAAQRDRQRLEDGVVVRVSGLPSRLGRIIRAAERAGGSVVGRAGLGLTWIAVRPSAPGELVGAIEELREELSPLPCVVQGAPLEVREKVDVWGRADGPEVALMRRVKTSFDPSGVYNPGVFVGAI
jgi:glycolate oxidase FAD binding subunit